MRVLVTGITGFVGSHMADYLLTLPKTEVYGIKRWSSRMINVRHLEGKVNFLTCNILDPYAVRSVLEKIRPEKIFHFAAESFVSPSWEMPDLYFQTNIQGTLTFLEAIRRMRLDCVFHVAGSGEEYGLIHENEIPITEESPLRPINPYAVSKVAQDFLCYEHFMSYQIKTIRTRAFNHEGPRRDNVFALASFAYQIVRIEQGLQKPVLRVGNLEPKRNFTDVRDMVKAYWLATEKCIPGELYLIGTDQVYTIGQCLEQLLALSPQKDKIEVKKDPALIRPTDVPLLVGDYTKFKKRTGWEPEIPFSKTLQDILDYWRNFVKEGLY